MSANEEFSDAAAARQWLNTSMCTGLAAVVARRVEETKANTFRVAVSNEHAWMLIVAVDRKSGQMIATVKHLTADDVDALAAKLRTNFDVHLEAAGVNFGSRAHKPVASVGSLSFIHRSSLTDGNVCDVLQALLSRSVFHLSDIVVYDVIDGVYTRASHGPDFRKSNELHRAAEVYPENEVVDVQDPHPVIQSVFARVESEFERATETAVTVHVVFDSMFMDVTVSSSAERIRVRYVSHNDLMTLFDMLPADALAVHASDVTTGDAVGYDPNRSDRVYDVSLVVPRWYMQPSAFGKSGRLHALVAMASVLPLHQHAFVAVSDKLE